MSACGFISKGRGGQTTKQAAGTSCGGCHATSCAGANTDGAARHHRNRGSKLALWQAEWVRHALRERFGDLDVELLVIKTQGDKILDVPLAQVGGKGLFVKEIEEALQAGRVDLAVHSMKDMPVEIPAGLAVGRCRSVKCPRMCSSRATVEACGRRRPAAPSHQQPAAGRSAPAPAAGSHGRSAAGNLDTRLRKLDTENLAAVVLAAAGVKRLGLEHRITEHLPPDLVLPAVGQGALCIEIREHDLRIRPWSPFSTTPPPARRSAASAPFSAAGGRVPGPRRRLRLRRARAIHPYCLVADLDGGTVIKHRLSVRSKTPNGSAMSWPKSS